MSENMSDSAAILMVALFVCVLNHLHRSKTVSMPGQKAIEGSKTVVAA
jgi:hypothetical protein